MVWEESIQINSSTLEATSVELTWLSALSVHDMYRVSCNIQQSNTSYLEQTGAGEITNHTISLDLSRNTTNATIRGLLPGRSYTCCVSDLNTSSCIQANATVIAQPGNEISPVLAAFVGAAISAVITLTLLTAIVALTAGIIIFIRKRRAITRAKNRPVVRNESTRYRRRCANVNATSLDKEDTTAVDTPTTEIEEADHPVAKTRHSTKQPTMHTPDKPHLFRSKISGDTSDLLNQFSQPEKSADGGSKIPRNSASMKQPVQKCLKPTVPLKPPIQDKPRTLQRAKSQPDRHGFCLKATDEEIKEAEHIYDTADILIPTLSQKTKKTFVSTDNVAYTQTKQASSNMELDEEYGQSIIYY